MHVAKPPVVDSQGHQCFRIIEACDVETIENRFKCSLTSTATTIKMRSAFDSGKSAFTCGDIPIRAQLVTTDITLIVSKAN